MASSSSWAAAAANTIKIALIACGQAGEVAEEDVGNTYILAQDGSQSVVELAGADLGSGKVGEHADRPTGTSRGGTHPRQTVEVILDRSVAEVQPDDVDAGMDQPIEVGGLVTCGTDRRDDLRAPGHSCLFSSLVELILVRHALPERREVVDGPADPELSPDGHAQAEHMARYLSTERIARVFTSPLRRARQTAAPLAGRFGLDPVVVDDVAEYDRNSSEYIPIEELKASGDPRFDELTGGLGDDMDDPAEFEARVMTALESIIAEHAGESVAVVCHGGVINLYLASILGLPTTPPGFFYPNYTSIHRVAASRSGVRSVVTVNETAHLRHTGLPMGLFQKG